MEKKKQPDKKKKVHSTDLPNRDNKSPETTSVNEDQIADDLEQSEKEKHPEKGTWSLAHIHHNANTNIIKGY